MRPGRPAVSAVDAHTAAKPRVVRVFFRDEWTAPGGRGLFSADARVRTLRKVLVTYPEVRHIVADGVSFEPTADKRVLDNVVHFLQRQHWLVKSVVIE
jgi:hypothetical protein